MLKQRLIQGVSIAIASGLLIACKTPTPTPNERYQYAQAEIQKMFAKQPTVVGKIDFKQAMARGLQYNLDRRIKAANSALKAGQTEVAEFAMLPAAELSGSAYTRNNSAGSFGSDANGNPTNIVSNGTDRTLRTARGGLKWNLQDLGLGYVKARQADELRQIAEEEARKQLQKLVQDVRISYWRAYSAQQLIKELKPFHHTLQNTRTELERALADQVVPKEELLNFQSSLLEGNRRLVQLEDKLNKAKQDFTYLLNLRPGEQVVLEKPPASITKVQNLNNLNFEKLDAITLVNRPELRGQNYQKHIAQLGVKAAIFEALPVITFNLGRNYNSNSFLVNNFWNDKSVEAYWNIFNLAALPVSLKTAKTQIKFESLRLMSLTLGALNETRINYAHYQNLSKEYQVAHRQTLNAKKMYTLMKNRESASLASKQQVVLAKLHFLFAKMDEDLLVADLSTMLGELYLSAGFDVMPLEITQVTPEEALLMIEKNLSTQNTMDFKCYVNDTYEKMFGKNKG